MRKEYFYEEIGHTADVAIRVQGEDLTELFANAAYGMFDLMTVDLTSVALEVRREIRAEAEDVETLLVDWLSELLYHHEVEGEAYREFDLTEISRTYLSGFAIGGPVPQMRKDVKAITYHGLTVEETPEGYTTTVIFDV